MFPPPPTPASQVSNGLVKLCFKACLAPDAQRESPLTKASARLPIALKGLNLLVTHPTDRRLHQLTGLTMKIPYSTLSQGSYTKAVYSTGGFSYVKRDSSAFYTALKQFKDGLDHAEKESFKLCWNNCFKPLRRHRTRLDPLIASIRDHEMLVRNQATSAGIEEVRRDRLAICQQHEAHRLRKLYTWLRSPDHDQISNAENDQYARVRRDCPGSGGWVLSKHVLNEWVDPAFPAIPALLWTNRSPGANVENDIGRYSLHEAAQIQSIFQLSDDMRANIAYRIKKAADVIVRLMASNLKHQTTVEDMKGELQDERLPRQLDDALGTTTLSGGTQGFLWLAGGRVKERIGRLFLAHEGYHGFMDYAVTQWVCHVEEAASGADEGDAMIKDLAEPLTMFESLTRFHDLEQAVVWARKEPTFFGETRESERALDLGCVVGKVCSELERAIDGARNGTAKEVHDLEATYGPKPFKCSRLSCRYFYDGFTTAQQREQHHDKQLLQFRCTTVGCYIA
ncbi:hypothetical protein LA080_010406 [Diaporthe eres]|nr:hypothetical protein LA080_010406 [Diaporthe eres]